MAELPDTLKADIQQAYRDFLQGKGIRARYGQRLMIAEITRYLAGITQQDQVRNSPDAVCVLEAGTGTGKTLAYLLAALPMARHLDKKLVVATATVALQDQIVNKDLPELLAHSRLRFNWALAKGRGRYLCVARLETQLHEAGLGASETFPLFMEAVSTLDPNDTRSLMETLLAQYASRQWDGDRDHWGAPLPDEIWKKVTTDHRQCTNRHCNYFDNCAFFAARNALEDADVIVANHDLVLADLALGGGAILPTPQRTIYIFDEAHHLPDKALNHFAAGIQLLATKNWLKQMSQAAVKFAPAAGAASTAARTLPRISEASRDYALLLDAIELELLDNTPWPQDGDRRSQQHRYANGTLPAGLSKLSEEARLSSVTLVRQLDALVAELQKSLDERRDGELDREAAEAWYPVFATFHQRAEEQLRLWRSYCQAPAASPEAMPPETMPPETMPPDTPPPLAPPLARWTVRIRQDQSDDMGLYSSPVLADHLLNDKLWQQAFAVVLTSATLTALGCFDRIRTRAGLPDESRFLVVPSSFRYAEKATLQVPKTALDPSSAGTEGDNYTQQLAQALVPLFQQRVSASQEDQSDVVGGVLVLFTSRRQMQEVRDQLAPDWPDLIRTQDDMAKGEVLAAHKARIDQGLASVLFGVASFAEGIDLPGRYLEHVIITRLPFSVPDDPIEAGLADWISARGGNAFMEISVPDASVRLVQAVGRLLRTEEDVGRVTILDKRIVTRRYGQLLLNGLPPFRRVFE